MKASDPFDTSAPDPLEREVRRKLGLASDGDEDDGADTGHVDIGQGQRGTSPVVPDPLELMLRDKLGVSH
jgi:hypothetical protein